MREPINFSIMINLGKALTAIRRERGLIQTEVASLAKISNSYLSEIENDKKKPDLEILDAICKVLKVPIVILLFKAINEVSINDPDKKRLIREIKPLFEQITQELYFNEPVPPPRSRSFGTESGGRKKMAASSR